MSAELPTVSFISALLVLIPLPWHWKTRNICTTAILLWLAACNIFRGINTVIWVDNTVVKYKAWCDIASRVELGSNFGVPAATVCICRRLAHASAPYYRAPKPSEKRQRVKFEIGMCIVLPSILTSLHIIVESRRFGITQEFGCGSCYYPSLLSLFITEVPTILLSWIALIYSGVALRWLIHRRVQFQQASHHPQSIATSGRYLRLVALAITQMTFASVMSLFLMTISVQPGINSWTSWEAVHENWHEIFIQSKDSMPEIYWVATRVGWYFVPIASVATFGYFGFDDGVIEEYKCMFAKVKTYTRWIRPKRTRVSPLSSTSDAVPCQSGPDANTIMLITGRGNGRPAAESLALEEARLRDICG